ncbi:TonB-dependent receptor family protein [Bowmanella denitrificans]|uniref:TonB-dependent receptor family protein n=1 Tax=Bowmanella denitrificans TaxID=366582 RepID=UPI000C9A0C94|nr:TonB-dependent receptor [Bowmanella denitrificans]
MLTSRRTLLASCLALCLIPQAYADDANPDNHNQPLERILVQGAQSKLDIESEQALTPGGVSIVDSEDFYQRNVANLADMLRFVPGLWVASGSTGDSSFFSSRGSNLDATSYDGNGIKLLQDGLPITAADGNNHNRSVDPLSTRYAVVARGANALTYGASTLGGAIDFISPTAHDLEPLQLVINGGSHGLWQGRLSAAKVSGNLDGVVTLESRKWDGFRGHQQQNRQSLYANGGWQASDNLATRLYLTYIDNDQELPGALSRAEFDQDPYQGQAGAELGHYQYNVRSWRVASKTQWDISPVSSLSVGLSHEQQALYHPIVYNPFFSLLIDTDQHNSGLSLRYNHQWHAHDVLMGLNYGQTSVKGGNYRHDKGRRTELMTRVDNDADSLEAFVVDRWQFAPNWKLIYGVQGVLTSREVRNLNVDTGALYHPDADYQSVNPRLGLIYQWHDNIEVFTNLSRLYEPPTNYELEDDASPDDSALKAMQGEVIEIGSRGSNNLGQSGLWHWELALYYARLQDEILSVDDPDAPGTSLATNVDNTIHAGLEAMLAASLALGKGAHRLEPKLSLTLNEFSFDKDSHYGNNTLPSAPGYVLRGEVIYRHDNGWFIGPTFDKVDARYADFNNSYEVDGYSLLGLRGGYSGKSWEIFAELRNLTDRAYVSLVSVRNQASADAAILQAGEPRSFYAGFRMGF